MGNYTNLTITAPLTHRESVIDRETGEFTGDFNYEQRKPMYFGPRKYWRQMAMYDKALLAVPTEIGIRLLTHLKSECSTSDYTILLNVKELASIFKCNDRALRNSINKLIDGNFIHRISPSYYMVNPDMFWIRDMSDTDWQECRSTFANGNKLLIAGKLLNSPA